MTLEDPVESFRLVSALLGALAAGLLMWRLIGTWLDLDVLHHALGILLVLSMGVGILYSLEHAAAQSPFAMSGWLYVLHRLAVLVVAVMWSRWFQRREAPWKRTRGTGP